MRLRVNRLEHRIEMLPFLPAQTDECEASAPTAEEQSEIDKALRENAIPEAIANDAADCVLGTEPAPEEYVSVNEAYAASALCEEAIEEP